MKTPSAITFREDSSYSFFPDLSNYNKNSEKVFIQSIVFDNQKIVDIDYDYEVMQFISDLLNEFNKLKQEINSINEVLKNNNQTLFVQGTLKEIWENDNVWDEL